MKNPGKYCLTEKGNKVIVRDDCEVIGGKVTAELLYDNLEPQKDAEGNQKKLLVNPDKCRIIGFVD